MPDQSILSLFYFLTTYPLAAFSSIGFGVLHYRLVKRFKCVTPVQNLVYGAACSAVAIGLFFLSVLAVRHLNMNARLLAQFIGGFIVGAAVVLVGRLFFPQVTTAQGIKLANSHVEPAETSGKHHNRPEESDPAAL